MTGIPVDVAGLGVVCPRCGSDRCYVADSRPVQSATRRRVRCRDCQERFTTYEAVADPRAGAASFTRRLSAGNRIEALTVSQQALVWALIDEFERERPDGRQAIPAGGASDDAGDEPLAEPDSQQDCAMPPDGWAARGPQPNF